MFMLKNVTFFIKTEILICLYTLYICKRYKRELKQNS